MSRYVTGDTIKMLREQKGFTQKQLAGLLAVSDKAVSKWETGRGLPDGVILEPLAKALGVSVLELLSGESITNQNRSSKMSRSKFYVCPVCGNVIHAAGEGVFCCCGITLPPLEAEEEDEEHQILVEEIDGEYHVSLEHEMTKEHHITFLAYVTLDRLEMKKLYSEQSPEGRFSKRGHGILYVCCNRHGLYSRRV